MPGSGNNSVRRTSLSHKGSSRSQSRRVPRDIRSHVRTSRGKRRNNRKASRSTQMSSRSTSVSSMQSQEDSREPATVNLWTKRVPRPPMLKGEHAPNSLVLLIRCAERVDRIFPEWLSTAVAHNGVYVNIDLNLPLTLPKRDNGYDAYEDDSPITELGTLHAQTIGQHLRMLLGASAECDVVTSPALRCAQTASAIIDGLRKPGLKAKVEPGLFEYTGWYSKLPKFATLEQLCGDFQLQIDQEYDNVTAMNELRHTMGKRRETLVQANNRNSATLLSLLLGTGRRHRALVVVTHAQSIDACARSLLHSHNTQHTQPEQIWDLGSKYPYCGVVALCKQHTNEQFIYVPKLLPPFVSYAVDTTVDFHHLLDVQLNID